MGRSERMKEKHCNSKLNIERINTFFPKKFRAIVLPVGALGTPGDCTVLVMFLPTACDIWLVHGLFNCVLSNWRGCLVLNETRG